VGPLLYINDIADNTQSFSRLFADDTSLLYSSNNKNEIEVIVNSDLSKINALDMSQNTEQIIS
jgi:hypothetical protein